MKNVKEGYMGNIVNKYQKYCGTCAFWDGKVVAKDSVKVEINSTNAKCTKKNQYFNKPLHMIFVKN